MRRKLSSFFLSSITSSRSRLYLVIVRIGVIIENTEPHELARQIAVGLDQPIDVLGLEAAGPEVDEAEAEPLFPRVAVEVDRRDREHEVLHRLGVQRGIAEREHPALAD